MTKGFKKGMAVVLTAALALSTPVALNKTAVQVQAADNLVTETTAALNDEVDASDAWFAARSKSFQLSGNFNVTFDITLQGINKGMDAGNTSNYDTPTLLVTTDKDYKADGYVEYVVQRSDQFGWGDNYTLNDDDHSSDTVVYTNDWFKADETLGSVAVDSWATWLTAMEDGIYSVNVERVGDVLTVTFVLTATDGKKYSCTDTITKAMADDVRLFLTGEHCKYTINSYTVHDYVITGAPKEKELTLNSDDGSTVDLSEGVTVKNYGTNKGKDLKYVSSNTAAATVDESTGVVTAKGNGETTITAYVPGEKEGVDNALATADTTVTVTTDLSGLEVKEPALTSDEKGVELEVDAESVPTGNSFDFDPESALTVTATLNGESVEADDIDYKENKYTITLPNDYGTYDYVFTVKAKDGYVWNEGKDETKEIKVSKSEEGVKNANPLLKEVVPEDIELDAEENPSKITLTPAKTEAGESAELAVTCNSTPVKEEDGSYSVDVDKSTEMYVFEITASGVKGYADDTKTVTVVLETEDSKTTAKIDTALIKDVTGPELSEDGTKYVVSWTPVVEGATVTAKVEEKTDDSEDAAATESPSEDSVADATIKTDKVNAAEGTEAPAETAAATVEPAATDVPAAEPDSISIAQDAGKNTVSIPVNELTAGKTYTVTLTATKKGYKDQPVAAEDIVVEVQATATPDNGGTPTATPDNGGTPTATPDNGGTPTATPDNGGTPTATPDNGGTPTATPDNSGTKATPTPDNGGTKATATPVPTQTPAAAATQAPAATKAPATASSSTSNKTTTTAKKKTMKLSAVKVKKGTKKITGKVSVKKATVKIKVGKKKYKKAKVSGKKFTLKTSKLKKGTKVTIKVTKSGYKTLTKTYKVK